ncbi:hypothetical protein MNV49_005592 [Pseudohyphozyma bogoriensis]|nr:hypothetical protein MNV49_005592 [Pseudohyphozyma bogoriensis]
MASTLDLDTWDQHLKPLVNLIKKVDPYQFKHSPDKIFTDSAGRRVSFAFVERFKTDIIKFLRKKEDAIMDVLNADRGDHYYVLQHHEASRSWVFSDVRIHLNGDGGMFTDAVVVDDLEELVSWVGWDHMVLDDCEQCAEDGGGGGGRAGGPSAGGGDAPFDSFTECCTDSLAECCTTDALVDCCTDTGCFGLPEIPKGPLPAVLTAAKVDDNCPACWRDDLASTESGSSVETPVEQSISGSPPHNGLTELFKGLDDKAIQDILACVACAPEYQHNPTWDPSQHASHTHIGLHASVGAPYSFPLQPLSAPLSLPPAPTFSCKWQGCNLNFHTKELLVSHVNGDHLLLGSPPQSAIVAPPANPTPTTAPSYQLAFSQAPIVPEFDMAKAQKCLWDDCGDINPAAALFDFPNVSVGAAYPSPAEDEKKTDPATSTLLDHLIQTHLAKLEPLAPVPENPTPDVADVPQLAPSHSHPHHHEHEHAHAHGHGHSHAHGHSHSHAHIHHVQHSHPVVHTEPIASCSSTTPHHHHTTVHRHSRPGHRHHGHPYGVHSRNSSSPALAAPTPSSTGAHVCKWKSCGLTFDTSPELMSHLSLDHVGSGKASYTCEWEGCERSGDGKGFAQRQKVMRHLQTHTGDRPFVCEVCSKSFSEATTLTQHMRVHTQERPYKCTHPGCQKAFSLASALTIHLRTHTGDKPFKCPYPGCTSAFSESSNLSKHVRTHKGERSYACDECGKAFSRSDQLARHKKIHSRARGEIS